MKIVFSTRQFNGPNRAVNVAINVYSRVVYSFVHWSLRWYKYWDHQISEYGYMIHCDDTYYVTCFSSLSLLIEVKRPAKKCKTFSSFNRTSWHMSELHNCVASIEMKCSIAFIFFSVVVHFSTCQQRFARAFVARIPSSCIFCRCRQFSCTHIPLDIPNVILFFNDTYVDMNRLWHMYFENESPMTLNVCHETQRRMLYHSLIFYYFICLCRHQIYKCTMWVFLFRDTRALHLILSHFFFNVTSSKNKTVFFEPTNEKNPFQRIETIHFFPISF